jgi:hypothetical protein
MEPVQPAKRKKRNYSPSLIALLLLCRRLVHGFSWEGCILLPPRPPERWVGVAVSRRRIPMRFCSSKLHNWSCKQGVHVDKPKWLLAVGCDHNEHARRRARGWRCMRTHHSVDTRHAWRIGAGIGAFTGILERTSTEPVRCYELILKKIILMGHNYRR